MNSDTWLVVPLYNEAQVIHDVVLAARETFPNIVCVDDGSTDDSAERARSAGALVVRHPINLGQGAAIQTGLSYALQAPGAEYLVTFDADGQHRAEDALAMVHRLRAGEADVVLGSRFLDRRTRPKLLKRIVLRAAIRYSNLTSGVRLTDTHNGLRAFTRSAASQLDIRQSRMAHASEMTEQIGKLKLRYVEHPVHILYTDYSMSKGQSVLNSVNIITEMLYKQAAPMWIQIILLLALVVIAAAAVRSPRGARHQAVRRIAVLVFTLFAVATVLFPDVWTTVANSIGIGRGTDLLLYILVVVFLGYMASSYQSRRAQEAQITQLARRIALDSAPRPWLEESAPDEDHSTGS